MIKLIFITGGSASGKTTLANQLKETFGERALLISQDMFYKPTKNMNVNYDEPQAFDFVLQKKVLNSLAIGKKTKIPIYDFSLYNRVGFKEVVPTEIVIFEGLFTFTDLEILKLADLKIFVDTPADTRLGRRIIRDVKERNRSIDEVIARWNKDVQPSYKRFISGVKPLSDMIIPWTIVNHRATNFIAATIDNIPSQEKKVIKI